MRGGRLAKQRRGPDKGAQRGGQHLAASDGAQARPGGILVARETRRDGDRARQAIGGERG